MRILKFRAWNEKTKQYVDPYIVSVDGLGNVDIGGAEVNFCIIEMFTGRTDKNGVEIFAGDIVKFLTITDESGNACDLFGVEEHLNGWVNCVYAEERKGVIEYSRGGFIVRINKHRTYPVDLDSNFGCIEDRYDMLDVSDKKENKKEDFHLIEVIGNIHLNKDLLK